MTRRLAAIALLTCLSTAPLAAQSVDRFEALVGLARVKRDAGEAKAALRYFDEARQLRAFEGSLLAEYFWVLVGENPARGFEIGLRVLTERPLDHDVRDRLVAVAVAHGNESQVIDLAFAGTRQAPEEARWYRRLGESYLRQARPSDAATAYNRAVEARGAQADDWAGLALALEAALQPAESLDAWARVPEPLRSSRNEWARSRLRAMAAVLPAEQSAPELDAWLATHPDDTEMRSLLVETWVKAGAPRRALDALGPLVAGDDGERWQRREVELARAAGDSERAIVVLESRVRSGRASIREEWTLAEWLVDVGRHDQAATVARRADRRTGGCDERFFKLLERFPEPESTDRLIAAALQRAPACPPSPGRILTVANRAIGQGRRDQALELVESALARGVSSLSLRAVHGQLLAWTGNPTRAATVLERVVAEAPDEMPAALTLIDTYRAIGAPQAAWSVAERWWTSPAVSTTQRLEWAGLAIEADRPQAALDVAEQLEPQELRAGSASQVAQVRGRALVALGRPAEAWSALATVPVEELSPAAALASIDAEFAMAGRDAALAVARRLPTEPSAWREVTARRAMLEAVAGDGTAAQELRRSIAAADPSRALLLDAEIALAEERPAEALAVMLDLPAAPHVTRAGDLSAIALAGVGNYAAALEIVDRLQRERPRFAPFEIRKREWAWRQNPTPENFESLIGLPTGFPGRIDAATVAARALAESGRHREALELLGGGEREWQQLPIDGKVAASVSLRALGRPKEALALLSTSPLSGGYPAILRAELVAAVDGPTAGAAAFEALASSDETTPDVFVAWLNLETSASRRVQILDQAVARFPRTIDLVTRQASARMAARDPAGALRAANTALALDERHSEAWFVKIDATVATGSSANVDAALDRFAEVYADDPALVIAMADRLAALARSSGDPVITRALRWLDATVGDETLVIPRSLSRARVLAAAERWAEALATVDATLAGSPQLPSALRLRADLLAWSGQHEAALVAYDTYLSVAPDDVDARRQQARVTGWGGDYDAARRRYEALVATHPAHAVINAEASAKTAFYDGRWRTAVGEYRRWLAIEPDNREAGFELSEALRAAGDDAAADTALSALESATPVHRLAAAAGDRARFEQRPSGSLVIDQRSSDGYDGQRLLELQRQGGAIAATLGGGKRTVVSLEAASAEASAGDSRRRGYQAQVTARHRFSSALSVDGHAGVWDLGGPNLPDVALQARWTLADRWSVVAGGDRRPVFENLDTVDAALTASGGFGGARFETPRRLASVVGSWQRLSDGNDRTRVTLSGGQALVGVRSQLRAVAWAEYLAYREARPAYFSPSSFVRVDGGVEWAFWFDRPRFRGDRDRTMAVGYLLGTDNRGEVYHHPSVRVAFELAQGFVIAGQANWIRSGVYDETSFLVGLRVGGTRPLR